MVNNFTRITIQRLATSKMMVAILLYAWLLPYLIMIMEEWTSNDNAWNMIFFIFGNRYIYFFFIIPVFLIVIYDIANGGNLRYCVGRLESKRSVILGQIFSIWFFSLLFGFIMFSAVLVLSFWRFGMTYEWSSGTLRGMDFNTLFYKNLTPIEALLLLMVRFFMSLIFLGMFYLFWQTITKRRRKSEGIFILFFLLAANAIFNVGNIPLLTSLDLSFLYIYQFDHRLPLELYALTAHLPLFILSTVFGFLSWKWAREVEF